MKLLAIIIALELVDIALTIHNRRLIIHHHKKHNMDLQSVSAELDVLKGKIDKNNALLAELKKDLAAAKANAADPQQAAELQAMEDKIIAMEQSIDAADADADPNQAASSTGSASGQGTTDTGTQTSGTTNG